LGYRVIIADDEIKIRTGIVKLIDFTLLGFTNIRTAKDGNEVLKLFREEQSELIITDIRMPGMDGIALIKNLKDISPDVEIIIISGYNDFENAKEAIKYGVKDFIIKPIDPDELSAALNKISISLSYKQSTDNMINQAISMFLSSFSSSENILVDSDSDSASAELLSILSSGLKSDILSHIAFLFEKQKGKCKEKNFLYMQKILMSLLRVCGHYNINFKNLIGAKEDILLLAIKNNDMNKFHDMYLEMCFTAHDIIKDIETRPIRDIRSIVKYIDTHYWDDLNLKHMSQLFYLNTAYLGQQIKKEVGMNFNSYLNNLRINRAKYLLINTDLSIKDVSEKVGYKNINHFYISFKSLTSINPKEYQLKYRRW